MTNRVLSAAMATSLAWLAAIDGLGAAAETVSIDRESTWQGRRRIHFQVAGRDAYLVLPEQAAPGRPWVWRARFPDYHAEMDVELIARGFHVGYVDVAGRYGAPAAIAIGEAFYETATGQFELAPRPALEGVSRGGLFVYQWALAHPDRVACIYCDTPVLDFKSWPGGRGAGVGSPGDWKACLAAYGLTEAEVEAFSGLPVDRAEAIAAAGVPLLHIVSENDQIVPPAENTQLLAQRLAVHDAVLEIISVEKGTDQSRGHHFSHPDPLRVVRFIERNAAPRESLRELAQRARRIAFLGDSITYSGDYVAAVEAWLLSQRRDDPPVVINVGLPSETVSGLSEAGHAGGRFPRPDLAERLDRVLATVRPDLVFACYGINCGIYQPLDDGRIAKFQQGVRRLKEKVEATGAEIVFITPPTFDDRRKELGFSYDDVLAEYSQWLLAQREDAWRVIDLHGPMASETARRRRLVPDFTFQPDAVHPNAAGHWYIATRLIGALGDDSVAGSADPQAMLQAAGASPQAWDVVRRRMQLLRNAYLSAAGHQRPGIPPGLPLPEAEAEAASLTRQWAAAWPNDE